MTDGRLVSGVTPLLEEVDLSSNRIGVATSYTTWRLLPKRFRRTLREQIQE
jgi:hypothetical protein